MVRLQYRVAEQDLVGFSEFHALHSPSIQRELWIARYIVALGFVGLGFTLWKTTGNSAEMAAFTIAAALWVVAWPSYWRRRFRSRARKLLQEMGDPALPGVHSLDADDLGITTLSPSGERTTFPWSAIHRFAETPSHLFIYTSATSAACVPKTSVVAGDITELLAVLESRGPRRACS